MNTKEITLQYIAGFFDGEGSIGIYYNKKNRNRFHLRTQLTQNKDKNVDRIMAFLLNKFGGNLSEQITLSGKVKYNWQLNADLAVKFLRDIFPYLIIKKAQAKTAMNWQMQRPKRTRDERGRIRVRRNRSIEFDIKVSKLMKALKEQDIDEVMHYQRDLCSIQEKLIPIGVIKG